MTKLLNFTIHIGSTYRGNEIMELLHIIVATEATYYIYNVSNEENIPLAIYKNNKVFGQILEDEIKNESLGLSGGDSFGSFVRGVINILRRKLKEQKVDILIDQKM